MALGLLVFAFGGAFVLGLATAFASHGSTICVVLSNPSTARTLLEVPAKVLCTPARRLEVRTKQPAVQQNGGQHTSGATHTAHRQHKKIKASARNFPEFYNATSDNSMHFQRCLDRPAADRAATPTVLLQELLSSEGGGGSNFTSLLRPLTQCVSSSCLTISRWVTNLDAVAAACVHWHVCSAVMRSFDPCGLFMELGGAFVSIVAATDVTPLGRSFVSCFLCLPLTSPACFSFLSMPTFRDDLTRAFPLSSLFRLLQLFLGERERKKERQKKASKRVRYQVRRVFYNK